MVSTPIFWTSLRRGEPAKTSSVTGLPVDPLGVGEPVHRDPQLGESLLDNPRFAHLGPLDEHRSVEDPARQHAHHGFLALADAAGPLEIADQRPGLLYVQKPGVHDDQHLNRFDAPWSSDGRHRSAARRAFQRDQ